MKFVVANRRAGKFRETEKQASRNAVKSLLNTMSVGRQSTVLKDREPVDQESRRTVVMEGNETDYQTAKRDAPDDVIVEPLIEHHHGNVMFRNFRAVDVVSPTSSFPTGTGNQVKFTVRGRGERLANATVMLFVRELTGRVRRLDQVTDSSGEVTYDLSAFFQPIFVIVSPYSGFWSLQSLFTGDATFDCPPLPSNQRIDWWHKETGFRSFDKTAGSGVRVGVIDTGFGPHPDLSGTDEGAFIDNSFDPNAGADVDIHGSHVCGTIAGNPGHALRISGVAPGVSLFSVRVFPAGAGATNVDIANAIDFLSRDRQCDLINMSLGAPVGSDLIRDAIQDAEERGTLCLCAAANSSGPVEFPAAFPEAAAISALGKIGAAPLGSVSADTLPEDPKLFGRDQLYFANFSCFGPEIEAIAPGVGIVATVPERHGLNTPYAALDGTSMATPIATGTLARALADDTSYTSLPRDLTRAQTARSALAQICRTIGLPSVNQGNGLPKH
ncbi:subtilisin [Labrenzia sp. EL_159]|nr:subtilisin [Labrenzia sp. EL_162]MBG6193102.1 subtilisin [Labrenzia sp. EL_159]